MEYTIISDLHEDIDSLIKILKLSTNKKKYISLGDNIGISKKYYSHVNNDANKCLSLMKKNEFIGVRGNHDNFHLNIIPKQSIFLYPDLLYKSNVQNNLSNKIWSFLDEEPTFLTEENIQYLKNFEEYLIKDDTLFSHFLFPDITGSVKLKEINFKEILNIHFLYMDFNDISFSFVGHLHVKKVQIISNKRGILEIKNDYFNFEKKYENEKFIIFCPSIIQNRIYLTYNIKDKYIKVMNLINDSSLTK